MVFFSARLVALRFKEDRTENIVLVIKKNNELKLVYSAKKTKNISYKDFVDSWTGVVVAIEKDEQNSKEYSKNHSILKPFAIGILALLVIGTLILFPLKIIGYGYLLTALIGLYLSILLVQKELGLHSKSLDKFCEASENNSCDDILNSKGATIFGVFKLSDVGIVYFSSIVLSIFLFSLTSESSNQLFYNLSVLSLLFIPYSIYYQWRIIKKWCPLCLIVIGVLLIQGLLVLFFVDISAVFNSTEIIVTLFSLVLLSVFWSELKSGLKKKQEFSVLQLEHYKFKRNASLFITALKSTDKKDMSIAGINEISLGNKNATLKYRNIMQSILCSRVISLSINSATYFDFP